MKNLPNKIYLNFGDITKEEFEESDYNEFCKIDEYAVTYCEDKVFDNDVEYIRKDAFIKKACEWLKDNTDRYLYNTGGIDEYIPKCGNKMIEDFKKYMEDLL